MKYLDLYEALIDPKPIPPEEQKELTPEELELAEKLAEKRNREYVKKPSLPNEP